MFSVRVRGEPPNYCTGSPIGRDTRFKPSSVRVRISLGVPILYRESAGSMAELKTWMLPLGRLALIIESVDSNIRNRGK